MNYDLILVRYGELSLKSDYVRKKFELKLINNIKNAFKSNNLNCEIRRERGRVYLYVEEVYKGFEILKRIFGITSFSPVIKTTLDIDDMVITALSFFQKNQPKIKSFALQVTRIGNHDFSSQDVAIKIGQEILNVTKLKVNLTNPDFELFIEIRNDNAYLFTDKICGMGGLPLGTQGKVIALIDSPKSILAAWYLMRRGCRIVFTTVNDKDIDLLHSFIKNWYADLDIVMVVLDKQKLYEKLKNIAAERSCDALVTGHTIYDTSCDVLSDIKQIKQHISLPILHPLIAMDSDEIDKKCKELGI